VYCFWDLESIVVKQYFHFSLSTLKSLTFWITWLLLFTVQFFQFIQFLKNWKANKSFLLLKLNFRNNKTFSYPKLSFEYKKCEKSYPNVLSEKVVFCGLAAKKHFLYLRATKVTFSSCFSTRAEGENRNKKARKSKVCCSKYKQSFSRRAMRTEVWDVL
jgi:hypothetical protein